MISHVWLIFVGIAYVVAAAVPSRIVRTANGDVQGFLQDGVEHYLNIPFASPPVGNNRFRSPQPVEGWKGVRAVVSQPEAPLLPICPQIRLGKEFMLGSEDCLYLDVFVPANATGKLPVMFWIYGGAFVFGDKWEFGMYDAKTLVLERNVIVVKANYRLGAMGFYALEALRKESPLNFTGNFGLEDQQAALLWVQANIAQFGGNPKQVTLFGESAGGISICAHLVSPYSRGLFHAAIIESGPCDGPLFRNYSLAIDSGVDHATQMGCDPETTSDVLGCLRALPANTIMRYVFTTVAHNWCPTVDGALIPDYPNRLLRKREWNSVPVLIGTVQDEGNLFLIKIPLSVPNTSLPLTWEMVNRTIDFYWGYNPWIVQNVFTVYPTTMFATPDLMASAIIRDNWFACPARRTARHVSDAGGSAWLYHFTYKADWIDVALLGVYHTMEIGFVFNHPWPSFLHKFGDKELALAESVGGYWKNMALHGTPNGPKADKLFWPRYDNTKRQTLGIDHPLTVEKNLYTSVCDFWDHGELLSEGLMAAGRLAGHDRRAALWQSVQPSDVPPIFAE